MIRSKASTRQPPAGGPVGRPFPDGLLQELRRGERDAFVRYFESFRAPVYAFSRLLLDDEATAVGATDEAFTAAFRRAIVDQGAADLEVLTYGCALDACVAHADAGGDGRRPATGTGRPFEEALRSLDVRRRAVLLLHDVHSFSPVRIAAVFATTEAAAGALLFRAREEFRAAFDAGTARSGGPGCRQAEQALAGAVGIGLADDQLERLRSHAAYCRPCRRAMRTWGAAPHGLAAALVAAPLPDALAAPPVFGAAHGPRGSAPRPAAMLAALRPAARLLRSRAVAYVVAAACLALAAGVAIQAQDVRPFVLFESVGPAVRLVTGEPDTPQAPAREDEQGTTRRSSSIVARASLVVTAGSDEPQAAAGPTARMPADRAAPTGPADGGPETELRDAGLGDVAGLAGVDRSGAGRSPKAEREAARSERSKAAQRPAKDKGGGGRARGAANDRGRSKAAHGDSSGRVALTRAPSADTPRATPRSIRKARTAQKPHPAQKARTARKEFKTHGTPQKRKKVA